MISRIYNVSCKHVFINSTGTVSEYNITIYLPKIDFNLNNKYDKNKNSYIMNVDTLPL